MLRKWIWILAYLMGIAALLGIGALLSQLPLYQQMRIPYLIRINAAQLAELASVGGALFVLWLMLRRLALQFYRGGWRQAFAGALLQPAAALAVLIVGQQVLRPYLRPLLRAQEWVYYDWAAVGLIGLAGIWLAHAVIAQLPTLVELLKSGTVRRLVEAARRCGDCGTPIVEGGRFCHRCGAAG